VTWLLSLLPALILQAPSPEVARVGSTSISLADVQARLTVMREKGDFGGPLEAVNGLIGEALLEAEARRLGLAAAPIVKAKVEREQRRLAGGLLVERDLAANARPAEAELRELYHSTADSVRLDVLVFEGAAAADAAARRIAKGGDFSAEAAGAVAHPAAALTMRAQVDPKLVTLAFQAPIGAVQGPAAASEGVAVFRVTERTVGDEAGFQVQRQALLDHATRLTVARARTHLVEQLRAKQGVKLDEPFLDGLPRGGDATQEQSLHVLATVGGRPITYGEILPAVRQLQAASGHPASGRVRKELAWQEIDTRLIEDLAMARGYGDDPQIKARLPALQSAALAQALAEQLSAAAPKPTEAEVAAFYRKHEQEIGQPLAKVRSTILTRLTAEKRSEAILAKVRELRGRADVQVNQAALSGLSPHG
jgi:hypothetical protein